MASTKERLLIIREEKVKAKEARKVAKATKLAAAQAATAERRISTAALRREAAVRRANAKAAEQDRDFDRRASDPIYRKQMEAADMRREAQRASKALADVALADDAAYCWDLQRSLKAKLRGDEYSVSRGLVELSMDGWSSNYTRYAGCEISEVLSAYGELFDLCPDAQDYDEELESWLVGDIAEAVIETPYWRKVLADSQATPRTVLGHIAWLESFTFTEEYQM